MELRQLRYFVRAIELGSMGRAAIDLGVVQSALSQQISRLEGELATRLLQRSARGVLPTDAGAAFFRERIDRIGLLAIAAATVGVVLQALAIGELPWISLVLGFSFASIAGSMCRS